MKIIKLQAENIKKIKAKDSNLNEDGSLKQDAWGDDIITYEQRRGI